MSFISPPIGVTLPYTCNSLTKDLLSRHLNTLSLLFLTILNLKNPNIALLSNDSYEMKYSVPLPPLYFLINNNGLIF